MEQHVIVGAGPVGTATAAELVRQGHRVVLVSRSGRGPEHDRIDVVALDAANPAAVSALATGARAIYNCANPAYHRWEQDWPPIARALLSAAETTGARLVTMSNLYGYGPVDGRLHPHLALASTGSKGRVRAAMWRDALAAHAAGRVQVTEARASDFFGPGLTDQSHLGSRTMPRLLAGKRISFLGDPELPHSLTYVPDVGATLARLGTDDRALGRAWHVPSTDTSLAVAARTIAELAGVAAPRIGRLSPALLRLAGVVSPVVRELHEVRYQFERPFLIDASETTETFGLTATPFTEGLAATLAWWRAGQPKYSPPLTSSV